MVKVTRYIRHRMPCGYSNVAMHSKKDMTGNTLLTCGCGRTGWGMPGLIQAHSRPSPVARQPRQPLSKKRREELGMNAFYNPKYDNPQERREGMTASLWREKHSVPVRKAGEKTLCLWYGHQESRRVPNVCYYCGKKKPRRKRLVRQWTPAPTQDPNLRPNEQEPVRKIAWRRLASPRSFEPCWLYPTVDRRDCKHCKEGD